MIKLITTVSYNYLLLNQSMSLYRSAIQSTHHWNVHATLRDTRMYCFKLNYWQSSRWADVYISRVQE